MEKTGETGAQPVAEAAPDEERSREIAPVNETPEDTPEAAAPEPDTSRRDLANLFPLSPRVINILKAVGPIVGILAFVYYVIFLHVEASQTTRFITADIVHALYVVAILSFYRSQHGLSLVIAGVPGIVVLAAINFYVPKIGMSQFSFYYAFHHQLLPFTMFANGLVLLLVIIQFYERDDAEDAKELGTSEYNPHLLPAVIDGNEGGEVEVEDDGIELTEDPQQLDTAVKIKRSQRRTITGKAVFIVDARILLSPEDYALVRRYRLGNELVYESQSHQRHTKETIAHADQRYHSSVFDPAGVQLMQAGKTMWSAARSLGHATAAAFSLHININKLMHGVHVECKSLGEVIDVENAIMQAARNVCIYLDLAATFDGREAILSVRGQDA